MDREWTATNWNKEAERILQQSRERIMEKVYGKFIGRMSMLRYLLHTKSDCRKCFCAHGNVLRTNECLDGDISIPLRRRFFGLLEDITARKNTEEKPNEAKIQYQNLFDLSPLPQWLYDLKCYSFKDVNQAAIIRYGYGKAMYSRYFIFIN